MKIELAKLNSIVRPIIMQEDGQDLTQVGLIIALVAVGATAGMNSVATAVGNAFSSLSSFVMHAGSIMIQ